MTTTFRKIALISTLALSTSSIFAAELPTYCPSADQIREQSQLHIEKDGATYIAVAISTYGSTDVWAFGIGDIKAKNADDARNQATKVLATLSGEPTPFVYNGSAICMYNTGSSLHAMAASPIPADI